MLNHVANELRKAVELYYPRVKRRYANLIGDVNVVDDLSQEVFTRLCYMISHQRSYTVSWSLLEGISKNVYFEHLRRKSKQPRGLATGEDFPDGNLLTPQQLVEEKDTLSMIIALLGKLSREEREVIIGRHYWGMNGRELSKSLGVPRTTLVDRYNRGMKNLLQWALKSNLSL